MAGNEGQGQNGFYWSWDDLATFQRLVKNPKDHDLQLIDRSFGEFGYLVPTTVNDVTGHLIAGHGRIDDLQIRKAAAREAPEGIQVDDKTWRVPTWHVRMPEEKEYAAAIALNRSTEVGGWDESALTPLLADIAARDEELLLATGYDRDDVDMLLKAMAPFEPEPENGEEDGSEDGEEPVKPESWRLTIVCEKQSDFDLLLAGLSADVSELGSGKAYTVPFERIVLPGMDDEKGNDGE